MNKVIINGRLTRDPETRYSGETCVSKFTLAVNRTYKKEGEPSADFINCTAFGTKAEFAEKYFRQGMKVAIVGRWQTGSYTNKDGQKVYTNDCIIESQEFDQPKSERREEERNTQPAPVPTPSNYDGFMNVPAGIDDELPFS